MKNKVTVEKVYHHSAHKRRMPTLLKFQNGDLAAVAKEKTRFCRVHQVINDTKKRAALLLADDQVYQGVIGEGEAAQWTDLYLCVRNKATNTLRILPVEQAHLSNRIHLEAKVVDQPKAIDELSQRALLAKFGGRKEMRRVNRNERSKLNIDLLKSGLDTTLEAAAEQVDMATDEIDPEKYYNLLRPKFNKDAKKIDEIYDIHDVIPAELLDEMEEEAKAVYGTSINKLPIESEYLRECLQKIKDATQSAQNFLHIKLILYMDCLYNLIRTRARSLKSVELSKITEKAENDVRQRFSDTNFYLSRTALTKEKASCYYILLAMLISANHKVDLDIIMKEISQRRVWAIRFANLANGKYDTKTNIVTLTLPSKMPPLAGWRRGKK